MHSILLSRLSDRFGPNGTALAWFESYLKFRRYYIELEGNKSTTRTLNIWDSPRVGLGPLLYVLYTGFMYSTEILNP